MRARHAMEAGFKAAIEPLADGIWAAADGLLNRAMQVQRIDVAADYALLLPASVSSLELSGRLEMDPSLSRLPDSILKMR